MNKLILVLITLISAQSLHGMENKPSPITFAQIYYHFSHNLLDPDIAQQIFFLQLKSSNVNLEKLSQSCENRESLVEFIKTLIDASGYSFASEVCEQLFLTQKISIFPIVWGENYGYLGYALMERYLDVARILIKIAGDNIWTLLTTRYGYNNQTILHQAASTNAESVKLILDAVGDKKWELLIMKEDITGYTALHRAVCNGNDDHTERIKLLLDAAGDNARKLIAMEDSCGQTALFFASAERSLSKEEKVIKKYMKKDNCCIQ